MGRSTAAPAPARRLRRLPQARWGGRRVRVAASPVARLAGLALLRRERAGGWLLIPRCRSVHTFGMLFRLDVAFLDGEGRVISLRRSVPPFRVVSDRRASAVVELPAGGEFDRCVA